MLVELLKNKITKNNMKTITYKNKTYDIVSERLGGKNYREFHCEKDVIFKKSKNTPIEEGTKIKLDFFFRVWDDGMVTYIKRKKAYRN